LETVERDFAPQGVKFYYIYKALAHPETNGYITPFTLEERLMHVAEAKKKLGSRITWLCDTMSNDAKHALGDAPNSELLIGPDGKVLQARRWSRPDELRADLEKLLGKVDSPTTLADIGMKPLSPPKTAPKGVVPRLKVPGQMTPLKVDVASGVGLPGLSLPGGLAADASGSDPLYVKLRVEVDSEYFRGDSGKLYLGFFLDPLYEVHWNNAVAPVSYEIEAPEGVEVTPAKGNGPQVEEKADADPREFLLDVSGESDQAIKVTVKYFACDDAETFCKPVTQTYAISLQRDRDGGSRRSAGRGRAVPGGSGRPGFGPPDSRPPSGDGQGRSQSLKAAIALFRQHDANKDGKLARDEQSELPKPAKSADADADGVITLRELLDAMNNVTGRSGPAAERRGRPDPADMFKRMDRDGDGMITKSEVPRQMLQRWDRMDTNGDGIVDQQEQAATIKRLQQIFRN
jgi:hypothetical protein